MSQVSDGLLGGAPDTDQRVFANTANSYRIEDDLVVGGSVSAATSAYTELRDGTRRNVSAVSSVSAPRGLGSHSDEYVGTAQNGHSIVAISFQEGSVVDAILIESVSGRVDPAFALLVARAQDRKIIVAMR